VVGPAKILLALSVAHTAVNVPDAVTGDPETVNSAGRLSPTEVTVPPNPVAEIEIEPWPGVMLTPLPAVKLAFVRVFPVVFPIKSCPSV
jgi:hypothetical protein